MQIKYIKTNNAFSVSSVLANEGQERMMNKEFDFNNENIPKEPSEEAVYKESSEEVDSAQEAFTEETNPEKAGEYSCISFNFADEKEASPAYGYSYIPPETARTVKPKKKCKKVFGIIALVLVCGIIFGTAFGFSNIMIKKFTMSQVKISTTEERLNKAKDAEPPASDVAAIAEACMPSIVAITNRGVSDVMTFFGTYSQESTSSGSGIIIQKNETELLIVTNYHVVANSKELSVVFSPVEAEMENKGEVDERLIPSATVKGYDAERDIAVIAVKIEDIPDDIFPQISIATIGDSSLMKPGDQVVAIGNSLGYGQSVTTGVISAVNRKITMQSSDGYSTVTNTFIQTDAAINQGNSGGALLDMNGNVIGINSVKIATAGVEGMGYAIPISEVEDNIEVLMTQKTRAMASDDKQGYLGISGSDVTSEISQRYSLPVGVFVNSVEEGLAAEKAGIKKGDVITKLEGVSILSISQLQDRLRYYEKGETVTVTIKRPKDNGYEEKNLSVTLSHRSDSKEN